MVGRSGARRSGSGTEYLVPTAPASNDAQRLRVGHVSPVAPGEVHALGHCAFDQRDGEARE